MVLECQGFGRLIGDLLKKGQSDTVKDLRATRQTHGAHMFSLNRMFFENKLGDSYKSDIGRDKVCLGSVFVFVAVCVCKCVFIRMRRYEIRSADMCIYIYMYMRVSCLCLCLCLFVRVCSREHCPVLHSKWYHISRLRGVFTNPAQPCLVISSFSVHKPTILRLVCWADCCVLMGFRQRSGPLFSSQAFRFCSAFAEHVGRWQVTDVHHKASVHNCLFQQNMMGRVLVSLSIQSRAI